MRAAYFMKNRSGYQTRYSRIFVISTVHASDVLKLG